LRQPITKGNTGKEILSSLTTEGDTQKGQISLVYKQLPKGDIIYANNLLYEFL